MRKTLGVLVVLTVCASAVAAPPVKLNELKFADFEKLPDDAVLDLGGRTMTKRALLVEIQKASGVPGAPLAVEAEKLKAKFTQDQKSRLEAVNAAVVAKATARAAQFKAVPKPTLGAAQASQAPIVAAAPRITSIDVPYLQPGFLFMVNGTGFGEEKEGQGKILVTGSFGTIDAFRHVGWFSWFENGAIGELPAPPSMPQTVSVVVELKDGRRTSPFSIPFQPGRKQQCDILHLGSVSWPSGPAGTCEHAGDNINRSVRCEHKASSNGYVSTGADRVSLNLKNGWGVVGYALGVHPVGQAVLLNEVSFTLGAPSMGANFTWAIANSNARTWWELLVCASGPDDGRPNQ